MTKAKSITDTACRFEHTRFKHSMSKKDVQQHLKALKSARSNVKQATKELQAAIKADDLVLRDELIIWLITSHDAKLSGVVDYAVKCDQMERPSLEKCIAVAEGLDLTAPIPEVAHVYAKKKFGKNEFRPIAVFGSRHRTAQAVVKRVLDVAFKPRSFQFSNRDIAEAIAEARKHVQKGRCYYAHLDIKSFYMHFEASKLAACLPLPAWAVENVLSGEQITWGAMQGNHPLSPSSDNLIDLARLGIPQGNSASSIVAMIECARLNPTLLGIIALMNYMDDFLLLAETKEQLESQIAKLTDAVGALPGGHFTLVTKSAGHLSEGCDFLGHHLRLDGEVLRIEPTEVNSQKLTHQLDQIEMTSKLYETLEIDKDAVLQVAADMTAWLNGWRNSFRECDDLESEWTLLPVQNIEDLLKTAGATYEDLKAITPKVHYKEGYHTTK